MWKLVVVVIKWLLKVGNGARTVKLAKYGRIGFSGLINKRPLAQLTHQEIRNAFAKVGLREAHNAHFISRLKERGVSFGIRNLDDLARVINNGTMQVGRQAGTVEIVAPGGRFAIVANRAGELITFLPL